MAAIAHHQGIKLGDGLGDFMRFTSDATDDEASRPETSPGMEPVNGTEWTGRNAGPARRPALFTGARSTGRH